MKILVTGGTNGMGKGVAKVLAGIDNQIHEIILLGRSEELGETTIKELENSTMNKKISSINLRLDISSPSATKSVLKSIYSLAQ